jgi:hypothetical protein
METPSRVDARGNIKASEYAENSTGTFGSGAKIPNTTQYNLTGMQPAAPLATATAIKGAANDPSVLAQNPNNQAAATKRLQDVIANGTGRSAADWQKASTPDLVSPFASFEQHSAALDKAIAAKMQGMGMQPETAALPSITSPPPEAGSIDEREMGRAQAFGPSYKPSFSPAFKATLSASTSPQPAMDPRFQQFPNAPQPLASAVTSSSFPQPPR